jgi:hypothetical protein
MVFWAELAHDRKCCGKFDEGVQIVWNGEEMHSSISTIFSPRVLVNFFPASKGIGILSSLAALRIGTCSN